MRQVRAGKLNFDPKLWGEVSDNTKDLLLQILTVDADKRISIAECLSHKSLNPSFQNFSENQRENLSLASLS